MSEEHSAEGLCQIQMNTPLVVNSKTKDPSLGCSLAVDERLTERDSEWKILSSGQEGADQFRVVGGSKNPLPSVLDLTTAPSGHNGKAAFGDSGIGKFQNRRSISNGKYALLKAIKEINEMAERMDLSRNIVDRASRLFNMVQDSKSLKGRSVETVASACFYIACRQEGVGRTFKEICAASEVPEKEICICFKLIRNELNTSFELIVTGDFMSRLCSSLGLPTEVEKAAVVIAKTALDLDLVFGRPPVSVAAAAVYMASLASPPPVKRAARQIAALAGLPEDTVKEVYREMYPRAGELFPKDFKFATPIYFLPLA